MNLWAGYSPVTTISEKLGVILGAKVKKKPVRKKQLKVEVDFEGMGTHVEATFKINDAYAFTIGAACPEANELTVKAVKFLAQNFNKVDK